jgi:hypothetical protein
MFVGWLHSQLSQKWAYNPRPNFWNDYIMYRNYFYIVLISHIIFYREKSKKLTLAYGLLFWQGKMTYHKQKYSYFRTVYILNIRTPDQGAQNEMYEGDNEHRWFFISSEKFCIMTTKTGVGPIIYFKYYILYHNNP